MLQLDEITGVGPTIAQRIIDARPFSSVDDLLRVKGIGDKTLQKIKDQGLAFVDGQIQQPIQEAEKTQNTTVPSPAIQEQSFVITYPTGIVLNEIMPSPEGADEQNEWIEIYNQNTIEIDLSSWKIYDTEGSIKVYTFPADSKIHGNNYLVLKRPTTNIILNNTKDGLKIENPVGVVSDTVSYTKSPINQSYNRVGSNWIWSKTLTPGSKNIISTEDALNKTVTPQKDENVEEENLLASLEQGIPKRKNFTNIFLIGTVVSLLSVIIFYFLKTKLTNKKL